MSAVANPWSPENWNLTAQFLYIKKYGPEVAKKKAHDAGSAIGALRPRIATGPYAPIPKSNFTVIVQRRGNVVVGGGGLVGAGSSGDGAPD